MKNIFDFYRYLIVAILSCVTFAPGVALIMILVAQLVKQGINLWNWAWLLF